MRLPLLAAAILLAAVAPARAGDGLTKGTPALKSASVLAFGPQGLLFVGDPVSTTIFALDTGDTKPTGSQPVNVERIDALVAAALGVTEKEVRINDVKVNPASGNVYLAVSRGTGAGQPAIVKVTRDGKAEPLGLKDVMFAQVSVPGQGKGKASQFTSMAFSDGRLFVAGLSNEEFASTLWVFPYPFTDAQGRPGSAIEIFHGAHGKIETKAPIRTFTPYRIGTEENIMASYTCTPLVRIPVAELKPGVKVKGTTIAELGSGNQPLDMIPYTKDGKDYLLSANTKHGVIKIPAAEFGTAKPITERTGIAGVKYEKITELKDVLQLDKFDDAHVTLLVKTPAGLDLKTVPLP